MTQSNTNITGRIFTHLTEIERGQIAAYLDEGLSLTEMGKRLEHRTSTISHEVKRGIVQQIDTNRKSFIKYYPDVGARVYEEN